jgi:hypothetical protein
MYIQDIDFRIDPLYVVIVGIDAGLRSIRRRLAKEDSFDGLSALEYVEPLLGLGFVAAQTYALGTVSDLNKIREVHGKTPLNKHECYKCDPIALEGEVKRMEVIHAIANYFKHQDEWPRSWPKNPTAQILGKVQITQECEFPCIKATELFCGKNWEFVVIHQVVKEWRKHLLSVLP